MTHGVIDRSSDLFYWGQSGAINESLADVMGEIVDHRNTLDGRRRHLAPRGGHPGRADPQHEQPTGDGRPRPHDESRCYFNAGNADSGGVHSNSGVGNKTAYLISQGGSFNGQTITGIDVGDPTLAKTAALYYDVIDPAHVRQRLREPRRRPRADLSGLRRPVACTASPPPTARASAKAVLATQLRTTPSNARAAGRRPEGLPDRQSYRLLFDSETGTPAAAFTAGPTWLRGSSPLWGSNAVSGHDSWYSSRPVDHDHQPAHAVVADQPARRPAELTCGSSSGGCSTTTARRATTAAPWRSTTPPTPPVRSTPSGQSWVNGPVDTLQAAQHRSARPSAATASGGSPAGSTCPRGPAQPVRPQFTMRTDVGRRLRGLVAGRHRDLHLRRRDDRDPARHPHAHAHPHPDADLRHRHDLRPPTGASRPRADSARPSVTWQPPTTNPRQRDRLPGRRPATSRGP